MVANEYIHIYQRKVVDTELQIAELLLRIPHEEADEIRAALQREVDVLKTMLNLYRATRTFLVKAYVMDEELITSVERPVA